MTGTNVAPRRRPVRVAVVGLGYWGPNLVRNLHELPEAELAAVCDLRRERAREDRTPVSRRARHTRRSTRSSTTNPSRRSAIATPVSTHHPLALAALDAGKHVFIEKPLAASADAGAGARSSSPSERGRVLMPGHTFLYSPPVNMIRELIESGELGDIYFVSTSRVNLGLHQPDVSVVWDLGSARLLDPALLARRDAGARERDRAAAASCRRHPTSRSSISSSPSEVVAHVELSWLAPSKLRRTTIVGSRKMIVYDDTSNEPVRVFDSGVTLRDPETFGEYQADVPHRRHRLAARRRPRAALLELADFCDCDPHGLDAPRSSRSARARRRADDRGRRRVARAKRRAGVDPEIRSERRLAHRGTPDQASYDRTMRTPRIVGHGWLGLYRLWVRGWAKAFSVLASGGFASFGARSVLETPLRISGERRISDRQRRLRRRRLLAPGTRRRRRRTWRSTLGDGTEIAGRCVLSAAVVDSDRQPRPDGAKRLHRRPLPCVRRHRPTRARTGHHRRRSRSRSATAPGSARTSSSDRASRSGAGRSSARTRSCSRTCRTSRSPSARRPGSCVGSPTTESAS